MPSAIKRKVRRYCHRDLDRMNGALIYAYIDGEYPRVTRPFILLDTGEDFPFSDLRNTYVRTFAIR